MIPLCCRDVIKYVDEDGTKWTFAPMSGRLEKEVIDFSNDFQGYGKDENDDKKLITRLNSIILKIVISCGPKDNRAYFNDKNIIDELTIKEKVSIVFTIWNKANTVSVDEKKS